MTVSDDSSEDHGHHLPAVEDWPRGFGEASWWPFVTAIGASGLYLGAALYIMSQGEDPLVGSAPGPVVFIGSTALFLVGLYGWVYHAFITTFWSLDADHRRESKLVWAMWLFLGTEVATFGAGFVYYFFIRVGAWPPGELPHLLSSLVLGNTAILILSSVTLHYAHVSLRRDDRRRFLGLLVATLVLGLIFIAGQGLEYYEFIVGEGFTIGNPDFSPTYASAFYGLTGLHGLHVSLGAVLLGILLVRTLYGQYSAERHVSVSTVSMYWHFVDVVWVFLVVVLYAGAAL